MTEIRRQKDILETAVEAVIKATLEVRWYFMILEVEGIEPHKNCLGPDCYCWRKIKRTG
jgi:hypothetical protein